MIEEYEYRLLADFLGDQWHNFVCYAEQMGYGEEDSEKLFNKLEEKANG